MPYSCDLHEKVLRMIMSGQFLPTFVVKNLNRTNQRRFIYDL